MRVSRLVGRKKVDLNVDIGEGFPHDKELLRFATSANICCGVHAGSPALTRETIEFAKRHGVRFGAHPGYPDPEHMGRWSILSGNQRKYLDSIFEQTKQFVEIAKPAYIKPHGGFYNDTAVILAEDWDRPNPDAEQITDPAAAYLAQYPGVQSLSMLLRVYRLPLMGLAATAHRVIAMRARQPLIQEGFADRNYTPEGTLVPRTEQNAMLVEPEQVQEQALRLAAEVDSICLHGDTESSLDFAELVYKALVDGGYGVGH